MCGSPITINKDCRTDTAIRIDWNKPYACLRSNSYQKFLIGMKWSQVMFLLPEVIISAEDLKEIISAV